MAKHTRTPWKVHLVDETVVVGPSGEEVASTKTNEYETRYETEAGNADRIVACVNACEKARLPDGFLANDGIGRAIGAMRLACNYLNHDSSSKAYEALRSVLSELPGIGEGEWLN